MSLRHLSADAKVLGGLTILLLALIALLNPERRELQRPPVSPEMVASAIEHGADHVTADTLAHMMINKVPGLLLVDLMAIASGGGIEVLPKPPVGLDDAQGPILNRNVARGFVEKLLVAQAGGPQFVLQALYLGNIGGDLNHQFHCAGGIADGSGVNDNRRLAAVPEPGYSLAALSFAALKCSFHG